MKIVLVKTSRFGTFVSVTPETSTPPYDREEYPTSTDTLCWHCCHAFDGQPVPLPLSYDHHRDAYKVYGTFCSFRCVFGYLRDNRQTLPGASNGTIGMTAFQMYRQWTGQSDPRRIERAPPRCMLKAFGGSMSIEQFRGSSDLIYDRLPPKCILHEQVYHERLQSDSHRNVRSREPSIPATRHDRSTGETLRLKRKHQHTVPVRSTGKKTILEQTLGII